MEEYDRYKYMDREEVEELDRIDRYYREHNCWPDEEAGEQEDDEND